MKITQIKNSRELLIMSSKKEIIVEILIEKGFNLLNEPYKTKELTDNVEANSLVNNLKDFPHAFVLACIMDRRVRAERAWAIPYKFSQEIGTFDFLDLLELGLDQTIEIF